MSFQLAEQLADAVLYEGYVLYPYRASAAKNRLRWQVGLVAPREYAEAAHSDPWWMQTECLAEAGPAASLTIRARALHVQERAIEEAVDPEQGLWRAVDNLLVGERQLVTWDEAVVCELTHIVTPDGSGRPETAAHPWTLDGWQEVETVRDESGRVAARIVRRRMPVDCVVHIATDRRGDLLRIRVRIENLSRCSARTLGERDAALRQSLAGTHTLLAIEDGTFMSLLEPTASTARLASECRNEGTWPVLVGAAGSRDVMLSSPIILYDYPSIAPESQGDLCDATEIDEMLMLRVRTLTDEEKREGRATDDRAARIIDRAEAASPTAMGSLHGAIRRYADAPAAPVDDWQTFLNPPQDAPPEAAYLEVGGLRIGRGTRVRLEPSHRSDSMDICLAGRNATVTAVYRTLEDTPYVAVILDDDPFGAGGSRYRRALFFHPDEIVPLDGSGSKER